MRGVTSGSLLGIFLDIFPRRNLPNFAAVIASVAVIASPAVIASLAVKISVTRKLLAFNMSN